MNLQPEVDAGIQDALNARPDGRDWVVRGIRVEEREGWVLTFKHKNQWVDNKPEDDASMLRRMVPDEIAEMVVGQDGHSALRTAAKQKVVDLIGWYSSDPRWKAR